MAITTLDPKTALIVIDLQKGIVGLPTAHPTGEIVSKSAAMAEAFRTRGLPVVLVNVAGGAPGRNEAPKMSGERPADWAELVPELKVQPSDILVTKHTWGAFAQTGLEFTLKNAGVTQIVLCGVATSIGVESTARAAFESGFNVTLATDAMTDMSPEAHANSVKLVLPRLGETGTTADIIALLK